MNLETETRFVTHVMQLWDGLRQIGDFSYAILPRDIAHALWRLQESGT